MEAVLDYICRQKKQIPRIVMPQEINLETDGTFPIARYLLLMY